MRRGWKLFCSMSLVFVVLMVLSFASCGKPSIVGYWQSTENSNVYIELTQDGNIIFDTENGIINGTYEILSDNYIKVTVSGLTGLLLAFTGHDNWRYEVTSSDLTLSADSMSKTFTRAKK
jgi:hypothetical protein